MAASSNYSAIHILPETEFGVIADGAPEKMRFTSESLQYEITNDTSKEIRDDRAVSDIIQLGASASGGVDFELSAAVANRLFEAAMGGTWAEVLDVQEVEDLYGLTLEPGATAHEVSNGKETRFFTVEKTFPEIGLYIAHRGMAVNTLELTFASASIATGSVGFMGKDAVVKNGSTNFSAPAVAAGTEEVINTSKGVGKIMLNGVDMADAWVQSISVSINNNLRAIQGVGHFGSVEVKQGTQNITGTIEVFIRNGSIYKDHYIDGAEFSLAWAAFDREKKGFGFHLPACKVNGTASPVAGGLDTDVVLSIPYQAKIDASTGKVMTLHRFG